jgi:hypothetical protein
VSDERIPRSQNKAWVVYFTTHDGKEVLLPTVEAPDEKTAIATAAAENDVPPELIFVQEITA